MKSAFKKRHRKEKRFRRLGLFSLVLALFFLGSIFTNIIYKGYPAFFRTEIAAGSGKTNLFNAHYIYHRQEGLTWITASDAVDMYYKHGEVGKLSLEQLKDLDTLKEHGQLRLVFNRAFFTHSDSREPELAGIWGGLIGSLLTLIVTFITAFPIGVGTAIYLEEFAPKNRFTHWIEANINNLAAVPSILFGLLGLVFFIHFLGLPRPSALVGGLTLALMSLPVIVVSTRAANKAP